MLRDTAKGWVGEVPLSDSTDETHFAPLEIGGLSSFVGVYPKCRSAWFCNHPQSDANLTTPPNGRGINFEHQLCVIFEHVHRAQGRLWLKSVGLAPAHPSGNPTPKTHQSHPTQPCNPTCNKFNQLVPPPTPPQNLPTPPTPRHPQAPARGSGPSRPSCPAPPRGKATWLRGPELASKPPLELALLKWLVDLRETKKGRPP